MHWHVSMCGSVFRGRRDRNRSETGAYRATNAIFTSVCMLTCVPRPYTNYVALPKKNHHYFQWCKNDSTPLATWSATFFSPFRTWNEARNTPASCANYFLNTQREFWQTVRESGGQPHDLVRWNAAVLIQMQIVSCSDRLNELLQEDLCLYEVLLCAWNVAMSLIGYFPADMTYPQNVLTALKPCEESSSKLHTKR